MKILKKVFNNVLVKWIIIPTLLLSCWFLPSVIFNPDAPFTVIVYKHSSAFLFEYHQGMLLKGQHIKGVFKAKENNLGIIDLRVQGGLSANANDQEYLQFILHEKNNSQTIYSNSYQVGEIRENDYLVFGFPRILNSKNRVYEFTIISLNGDPTNSLDLDQRDDFFISKYITLGKSLRSLKGFEKQFLGRLRMLFFNKEELLVSSIYFLPFLFYITIIGFTQIFKSKLGGLTLSSIFLSIIFIPDVYAGITLGFLGLWIIAVVKDKIKYTYSLAAAIFFFFIAGIFTFFTAKVQVDNSSMWGYLILVIGFIQIVLLEIKETK